MNERRYMDVDELSRYLGISKWLVYKFVKVREIPFIPFGRLVRFDRIVIDRWAEKRSVKGYSKRAFQVSEADFGLFEMPDDVLREIAVCEPQCPTMPCPLHH